MSIGIQQLDRNHKLILFDAIPTDGALGNIGSYTPPAGYAGIVRAMGVANVAVGTGTWQWQLRRAGQIVTINGGSSNTNLRLDSCYYVLEPGDELRTELLVVAAAGGRVDIFYSVEEVPL
jgi:hypothetical protein